MGTALRKAQKRANRRAALDVAVDQMAARKEKTRGAVSMRYASNDPGDFHRPANLSAKALPFGRNRSHLVTTI